MKKVFVSYSSRDRADAFKIKSLLESHGCEVWLDFFDIQPTAQLREQHSGNIKQADVVCLLLSPTAVASKWVADEIENALTQAQHGFPQALQLFKLCYNRIDLQAGYSESERQILNANTRRAVNHTRI
jgi:TIR domain-containing protein